NDPNNDGFRKKSFEPNLDMLDASPPSSNAPVVPLDCRPHITFGRPINDDAGVGGNPQPPLPNARPERGWEWIGDPAKNEGPIRARYSLQQIVLQKWIGTGWDLVAESRSADENKKLYGSWAPVPLLPDGGGENVSQEKLWLWSKTPFDYTRYTGRAWDDWFTD